MKKHLANIITSLRIMGSVVLLLFDASSFPFYMTYLLCGLSDVADGFLARKLHAESTFGSRLDSFADMFLQPPVR